MRDPLSQAILFNSDSTSTSWCSKKQVPIALSSTERLNMFEPILFPRSMAYSTSSRCSIAIKVSDFNFCFVIMEVSSNFPKFKCFMFHFQTHYCFIPDKVLNQNTSSSLQVHTNFHSMQSFPLSCSLSSKTHLCYLLPTCEF